MLHYCITEEQGPKQLLIILRGTINELMTVLSVFVLISPDVS